MSGSGQERASGARRGGRAAIDANAKGLYIEALRRGANHGDAARAAGHSRGGFARVRKRDPEFGAACEEAVGRSCGPRFIAGGANRRLQLRRNRRLLFTEARKEVFLSHFAGTANLADAAAAAGVCDSTIWAHRAKDPDFARRFQEALEQAYAGLDASVLARRIEEQKRLRALPPTGEPEPEFERAMKLLQRWDRRNGRVGPRAAGRGRESRWDFAEAIVLIEKKLRNMGIPIEPLPPGYERPDGELPLLEAATRNSLPDERDEAEEEEEEGGSHK